MSPCSLIPLYKDFFQYFLLCTFWVPKNAPHGYLVMLAVQKKQKTNS